MTEQINWSNFDEKRREMIARARIAINAYDEMLAEEKQETPHPLAGVLVKPQPVSRGRERGFEL